MSNADQDIVIAEHAARLERSSYATAVRSANDIHSMIALLDLHLLSKKDADWIPQTALILDSLKHSSLDGLDVQMILGDKSRESRNLKQELLAQAFNTSKQALFSHSSPVGAALGLAEHLEPFKTRCLEVMRDLDKSLDINRNVAKEDVLPKSKQRSAGWASDKNSNNAPASV